MKNRNVFKSWVIACRGAMIFSFVLIFIAIQNPIFGQTGNWKAPASADKIVNPQKANVVTIRAGKKLYDQFCSICHGKRGKGDGMAGMALKPRPANFTKPLIQKQTDGAIYWKITEGKPPMAAYKDVLTEEQRWQLVNFIRSLN